MKYSAYVRILSVAALILGLVVCLQAQTSPVVEPDPAYAALQKELQALRAQVKQLSAKEPSKDAVRDAYARRFKAAKDDAEPGCKAAGGKLRVRIDSDGKMTVECAW